MQWIATKAPSKAKTNQSNTVIPHRSGEWKGFAMVLDRRNGIDKKNSNILVFQAAPLTDPMQWIATKDPSKAKTNSSNTVIPHRSGERKGSALLLDRWNGIDKKNSNILVFRAAPLTDPMQWIATKEPSKVKTNSSNTIWFHCLGQWKGSALVLDRRNGIDKNCSK